MAVKTVNVQSFDAMTTFGQTAQVRQTANTGSQNFDEVLNKASDKVADKNKAIVQNTGQKKPEADTDNKKMEEVKENPEQIDSKEETEDVSEVVMEEPVDNKEEKDMSDENLIFTETKEETDKMTTEQVVDALTQIIEQIKELLGISDEELFAGMESIGIDPADLLNADNMAQLLTVIAGEGEAISLVTNEDLYSALQDLTETVENVSSQLLEETGLTQEELDTILEKLPQVQNTVGEEPEQSTDLNGMPKMTETVKEGTDLLQEEVPTVIVEENGELQQTKTPKQQPEQNQYEELPENQQENPAQETAKVLSQKSEHETHGQEQSNAFNGQQGAAQSPAESFNETAQISAENAVSYASGNVDSILKQLADFVKIIRNENLTEMELQLHPASLGTVNVSLVTKGGAVTAEFTTQNEAVRAAIESQVSQLVTNLEEQGVKVEAVEVSVASHEMERNLEENSQNDQSRQEQEEKQRIQGTRRNSINFNSFVDGDEIAQEMQGADDATRIAMELMAANGNSVDLMA